MYTKYSQINTPAYRKLHTQHIYGTVSQHANRLKHTSTPHTIHLTRHRYTDRWAQTQSVKLYTVCYKHAEIHTVNVLNFLDLLYVYDMICTSLYKVCHMHEVYVYSRYEYYVVYFRYCTAIRNTFSFHSDLKYIEHQKQSNMELARMLLTYKHISLFQLCILTDSIVLWMSYIMCFTILHIIHFYFFYMTTMSLSPTHYPYVGKDTSHLWIYS